MAALFFCPQIRSAPFTGCPRPGTFCPPGTALGLRGASRTMAAGLQCVSVRAPAGPGKVQGR